MTDLSPESRALLKGARDEFGANAGQQARVGRALATRLGIAAGAIAATTTTTSASAGAAGSAATGTAVGGAGMGVVGSALLTGTKVLGAALLVGAIGAGGVSVYRATRRMPTLPKAHEVAVASRGEARGGSAASAAGVVAPPSVAPDELSGSPSQSVPPPQMVVPPLEAPPPIRVTPHEIAPVSTVAPVGTVAQETRLLRRADESLRSGDAAHALVLLDEHARTFPHGVLAEERSAERVLTLCKLGHRAQARAEAIRFLRATPDSPLADSIRKSCGASDDGGGR